MKLIQYDADPLRSGHPRYRRAILADAIVAVEAVDRISVIDIVARMLMGDSIVLISFHLGFERDAQDKPAWRMWRDAKIDEAHAWRDQFIIEWKEAVA